MPKVTSWFSTKESAGGDPRWLFTLARANRIWRLTSSNEAVEVVATGLVYDPCPITRDRLERNTEVRADTIEIRVGRTAPIANALREVSSHSMSMRIEKYQPGDDDTLPIVEAFGDVANVRIVGGWVLFDLMLGERRFDQPFPALLVERQCQWPAFSAESGIDEAAFSYTTTIESIAGNVITVASIGLAYAGYYNSGQLKYGFDAMAERVFVDYHIGAALTIVGDIPSSIRDAYAAFLDDGDPVAVTLIAGDDRTLKTRRDRFGPEAVDRFLGFDLLPTTDPLQTGVNDAPIALNPYGAANLSPVPGSGVPFRMYTTKSSTDVDGTVRLVIVDPDAVVTDVEFRSNPWGIGGATTGYADMPIVGTDSGTFSTTYETTVARGSYGYVAIELRVTYLDGFGVPQTATGSFEFVPVGYDRSLLAREVAGILGFAAFGIPSQEGARVYTVSTLTGNVTLNFYIGGNQKFILVIDATGGPYTITLGTLSGPNLRESDGAPVVSLVVNGFTFFRLRYSLAAHATYWDV